MNCLKFYKCLIFSTISKALDPMFSFYFKNNYLKKKTIIYMKLRSKGLGGWYMTKILIFLGQ